MYRVFKGLNAEQKLVVRRIPTVICNIFVPCGKILNNKGHGAIGAHD